MAFKPIPIRFEGGVTKPGAMYAMDKRAEADGVYDVSLCVTCLDDKDVCEVSKVERDGILYAIGDELMETGVEWQGECGQQGIVAIK